MQRRVALARALAINSDLLLLDEPFVSIDQKLALEMQDLLAQIIARYRPTVVLVTHDPRDATRLADRVVRLQGLPARIAADHSISVRRDERDAAFIERESRRVAGEAEA